MERGVMIGGAMIVISCLIAIALNSHAGREASMTGSAEREVLSTPQATEFGCAADSRIVAVGAPSSGNIDLDACDATTLPDRAGKIAPTQN